MRNKKGFTLAEVLITVGIIGVIAAITFPALKSNIDKNTWTQSLKTSLSILHNGFAQMMADDETDYIGETTLWFDNVTSTITTSTRKEIKEAIKDELNKYFKIERMSDGVPADIYTLKGTKNTTMNSYIRFYLSNSTTINVRFLKSQQSSSCDDEFCSPAANIFIDVNGDKRPNTYGKDIYRFYLGENGRLYAYGSEAANEYSSSNKKWSDKAECSGKRPAGDGISCTARVLEEGFQITYN